MPTSKHNGKIIQKANNFYRLLPHDMKSLMTLKMPETTQKGITKTAAWRTTKLFLLYEKSLFCSRFSCEKWYFEQTGEEHWNSMQSLDEFPSTFRWNFKINSLMKLRLLNDSRWEEFFAVVIGEIVVSDTQDYSIRLSSLETSRIFLSLKTLNFSLWM